MPVGLRRQMRCAPLRSRPGPRHEADLVEQAHIPEEWRSHKLSEIKPEEQTDVRPPSLGVESTWKLILILRARRGTSCLLNAQLMTATFAFLRTRWIPVRALDRPHVARPVLIPFSQRESMSTYCRTPSGSQGTPALPPPAFGKRSMRRTVSPPFPLSTPRGPFPKVGQAMPRYILRRE